jgi:4'-phosphopantetheinyl transferase
LLNFCYTTLSIDFHEKCFSKWLALLPSDVIERIKKFRSWEDAQSTLLGYLLISKELLSGDLKRISNIQYNSFGKPFLVNNSFFNISHSGKYVVFISFKTDDIGIDIEEIDTNICVDDFFSQMTKSEQHIIETSNNKINAFYSYWTQKEAVIKAHGKGLSIPLKSFEIVDNKTHISNKQYFTKEVVLNHEYVCHISSTMNFLNHTELTSKEVCFKCPKLI